MNDVLFFISDLSVLNFVWHTGEIKTYVKLLDKNWKLSMHYLLEIRIRVLQYILFNNFNINDGKRQNNFENIFLKVNLQGK